MKLITFTCTDLSPEKAYEATKEKKVVVSKWSHLNLRRHNFFVYVVLLWMLIYLLLLLLLLQ